MSNNDKFIRYTPHGKLMEYKNFHVCSKCKYNTHLDCKEITDYLCMGNDFYYFAKDETNENKNMQNLQK